MRGRVSVTGEEGRMGGYVSVMGDEGRWGGERGRGVHQRALDGRVVRAGPRPYVQDLWAPSVTFTRPLRPTRNQQFYP